MVTDLCGIFQDRLLVLSPFTAVMSTDMELMVHDPWPAIGKIAILGAFFERQRGIERIKFLSRSTTEKAITYHLMTMTTYKKASRASRYGVL